MVSLYVYSGVLCCITLSVPNLGSKPLVNGGACYIARECWLCQIKSVRLNKFSEGSACTISIHRSVGFQQAYGRLHELRALVPPGTPMLAATAIATKEVSRDVISRLNMEGCGYVFVSPD